VTTSNIRIESVSTSLKSKKCRTILLLSFVSYFHISIKTFSFTKLQKSWGVQISKFGEITPKISVFIFSLQRRENVLFIPSKSACGILFPTKIQFHQHFTSSFYTCRSQKRKKNDNFTVFFVLLGSACLKAERKMLAKLTLIVSALKWI